VGTDIFFKGGIGGLTGEQERQKDIDLYISYS
jgi:hypothetical protein